MFNKYFLFTLLVGALALFNSAPVQAKDSAAQKSARKSIMAAYAAMDSASLGRDTEKMMAYIAPDYMGHSLSRGMANRDQLWRLTEMINNSDVKVTLSKTKVTKWQWRGPDAIVWVTSQSRAIGGRGTTMGTYTSRHYWGKPSGRWLLRQDVTLTRRAFQNGQLLPN